MSSFEVVAMRSVNRWWSPADADAISRAREQYDAGLIELCTKKEGGSFILLRKYREEPIKNRKPYFSAKDE